MREFDGTVLPGSSWPGPNLMEVVTFWMQAARGAAVAGDLGVDGFSQQILSAYL